jgi:benzoylformate decarboxylase
MSNAITKVQNANARRGGDVLLEVLESEGVEYVFGNPGTTELPFMDALLRKPSIQYVLALQEASAVAMADGYAQAAKKPGFLNLHTAGGLGHGMGNLLNAKCSQTPLVVTAGSRIYATRQPIHYCWVIWSVWVKRSLNGHRRLPTLTSYRY